MRTILLIALAGAAVSATALAGAADRGAGTTYTLTVTVAGDGTATSDPAGIDCGGDCTEAYADGTKVTVTGQPGPGATHTCINGCVEGSDDTTVTMDRDRELKVTFQKITPQGPAPTPEPSTTATASPSATPAPTPFEPSVRVVRRRRYKVVLSLTAGTDAQAAVTARVRVAGRRLGAVSRAPVSIGQGDDRRLRLRLRGALRRRVVRAKAAHPDARPRLRVAAAFTHGAEQQTLRRRVTLPR